MMKLNRIREIKDRYGQTWTIAYDSGLEEWYGLLAPDSHERDLVGPFDTEQDVEDHVLRL